MAAGEQPRLGMTPARALYAALLTLLQPLLLLRLWWRGRREPLYRQAIGERFGRYADAPSSGWLWLHAVSLGETRAAAPLIEALRAQRPGMRLLLTHGTGTGREAGRGLLRDGDHQAWLPTDTPAATRRFLAHFRPALGVLMETEIWPQLLAQAQAQRVPMVLANARLSERSQRRGQRLASLFRPAMAGLSLVLAQTADDARRLREAGAMQVEVAGNLKFDLAPDTTLVATGRAWAAVLARPVVLAAATRDGEEAGLLAAWLARPVPRPLLLLVPRHPQRFDEVAALVAARGLVLSRRSGIGETPAGAALQAEVWLGDSMGEMPLYYALAGVALLGGSFAPLGGQNLIEAAACGCPLLMGPHTYNFAEAAELALTAGAARRVADIDAAVDAALDLLAVDDTRAAMAAAGLAFAAAHRGAAQRMAQRITSLLPPA